MKKIITLIFWFFVVHAFANDDAQKAFDEGANLAQQVKGKTTDVVHDLKPSELPGYKTHADPEKYYKDETQTTDDLLKDAAVAKEFSEAGQIVDKSSHSRPQYDIDKTLPEMQRAKFIIDNSGNISHGIDSSQIKCENGQAKKCETTYTTETCSESTQMEDTECTKDLLVNVVNKPMEKNIEININQDFPGSEYSEQRGYGEVDLDLKTGSKLHCWSEGRGATRFVDCKVGFSQNLQGFLCNNFKADYLGYTYEYKQSEVHDKLSFVAAISEMPSCANGFHLRVATNAVWYSRLVAHGPANVMATLKFHFSANDYVISDSWNDNCGALRDKMQQKMCVFKSEDCSQGAQTRIINDVPVTRDCWQKVDRYTCSKGTTDNNCAPLREKKCDQIDSRCSKFLGDICLVYEQTYRCPVTHCEDLGISCGGETFCLSGNCTDHSYKPSADFAKNISALSALAEAQKDRQGSDKNFTVFSGKVEKCAEKDPVSFIDCCSDSGWGKDLGLAKCSADEKALAQHKEKKLTVEVGEYCSQYVLGTGTCWLYKKSYCLFNSKLARIIQQFGRHDQLGISFGDPENPDCRGIKPEELQKIDFSKIDFSDFTEDLKDRTKEPDKKATEDKLKERAKWCEAHPDECKPHKQQ